MTQSCPGDYIIPGKVNAKLINEKEKNAVMPVNDS